MKHTGLLLLFTIVLLNCSIHISGKGFANEGFLIYILRASAKLYTDSSGTETPSTTSVPIPVSVPNSVPVLVSVPISIVSTIPTDGTIDVSLLPASVSVTFNKAVDASSVTVRTSGSSCNGSVQISDDNFVTCIAANSQPSTTDNVKFAINLSLPISFRADLYYKIKVTTSAKDTGGNTLPADFVSNTGFKTTTPCGHNCFWSAGVSLSANAAPGSNTFLIQSGANAGKYYIILGNVASGGSMYDPDANSLTYFGGSSTTRLYDHSANSFAAGPAMPAVIGPGVAWFFISSGVNAGKTLVFQGGNSAATYVVHGGGTTNISLYFP